MKKLWSEINAPFLVFLVAMFLYSESRSLPPPRFEPMGPAFFPQWVLTGIMALSLYNVIVPLAYRILKGTLPTEQVNGDTNKCIVPLFATIGLFALYILVIVYTDIHFLLLSFAFISLLGFILAGTVKTHFLPIILTAAGIVGAIQLIFGTLLEAFFP